MSEPEKTEKQTRIMDAAQGLFSRYGLKKTSIEEIARDAGLGKGTVYLYFRSKDEIFEAVGRRFCQNIYFKLLHDVEQIQDHSRKLHQFILSHLQVIHDLVIQVGVTAEIFQEIEMNPSFREIQEESQKRQNALLQKIIDDGVKAGEFYTKNSEISALAISAALGGLAKPWHCGGQELCLEKKVSALVELYLNGLKRRVN
ncbi:MAG: TetR/AcrR family transcriptional regulator [Proteobacteria bacterium]|nr:TetR/AcrR family transcriptional regulator [Pseudomonadota bacterium]